MLPRRFGRFARLVLPVALLASGLLPAATAFAADGPDVYGTVVSSDRAQNTVTLETDDHQLVTVDVSRMGAGPWNSGVLQPNKVLYLRTLREGDKLYAWAVSQRSDGSKRLGTSS